MWLSRHTARSILRRYVHLRQANISQELFALPPLPGYTAGVIIFASLSAGDLSLLSDLVGATLVVMRLIAQLSPAAAPAHLADRCWAISF